MYPFCKDKGDGVRVPTLPQREHALSQTLTSLGLSDSSGPPPPPPLIHHALSPLPYPLNRTSRVKIVSTLQLRKLELRKDKELAQDPSIGLFSKLPIYAYISGMF